MYEYSYGSNNELREVRIPGLGAITIPDYTWNRPAKMVFPGGTQRTYGYDALMRLQALTVTDPGGNPLLDYQYTYNEVGNIMTKATEHGNYTYDYDASSRLTGVDNPTLDDETYTYDDVGNRLTSADVSGSWNYNLNNELLGYADVEYDYDENGNMTQITVAGQVVWTYTYDAANRLVHVEDGTGTISADYYYDPFGRRLWKEVGGERTYFFYSDEGLIGEYDASGNEIKTYGYKPDSTWTSNPLFMKQGTEYYFYQNDHLGTPQKLTAMNGAVVWSTLYNAFGEAEVQIEMVENNLRFPGQFFDAETGLLYNFQRYYDPRIGRYVSADPIGFDGGGINLYTYVQDNPLNRSDPLGMGSLTDVENGKLFYTWHMGWIDKSHAFVTHKSLIDAWNTIKDANDGEVVNFSLSLSGVIASTKTDFCLEVASTVPNNEKNPFINRKHQLLYAWMVASYQFEEAQGKWFLSWEWVNKIGGRVLKGNIEQTPSSFAIEDLLSNLINFYGVVDEKNPETLVNTHAGRFDPWDERIISTAIWVFALKSQPWHKSFFPLYIDYEKFIKLDFNFMEKTNMWPVTEGVYQYHDPEPSDRRYYNNGRQAQQLLPKYAGKYGAPRFPDYFLTYRPVSDGYIRIWRHP